MIRGFAIRHSLAYLIALDCIASLDLGSRGAPFAELRSSGSAGSTWQLEARSATNTAEEVTQDRFSQVGQVEEAQAAARAAQ